MIRCPDCGTDNRDGSRFCGSCGRELSELPEVICLKCSAPNSAHNVLCSDCLSPLRPTSEEEEGATGEGLGEILAEEGSATQDDTAVPEEAEPVRGELPIDEEALDQVEESSEVIPCVAPGEEPREPLDSIPDALPLENIMALPHRSESPPLQSLPPEHDEQAKLLSQVLVLPRMGEEALRLASRSRVPVPGKVMRIALYILLALAVTIPLITGNRWFDGAITPRASVAGLLRTIDALPAGSTVMVSFDYDPGTADELAPGVAMVLDHLLQRGVSILALSTMPAGSPLAWQQLNQAALRAGGLSYGEDYLLLGYLPGEESGLRRMTGGLDLAFPKDYIERRDSNQFALIQRAGKLSDIALTITLAGDRIHVQRWLEQVQAPFGVPLAAVVTAAAEPGLSPYFSSGQLQGMMAGLPAAAEYETLRVGRGPVSDTADAQALAYLVIIVAALLGNIINLFGGHGPKKADAQTTLPGSGE